MKYKRIKKQLKSVKNIILCISIIMGGLTALGRATLPEITIIFLMIDIGFLGSLACYFLLKAYLEDLIEEKGETDE